MLAELLLDYGIPLTLVAVLAALIRFRQIMIELDEHGYHFITSGLGFLALAVVLRLYHQADMLVRMPFLSETMFYRLLFWSAITAGTGLLVSGLASHLPAMRTVRREANRKLAGLELIRTIERLSAVEPRTDVLIRSSLGHISSALGGRVEVTSQQLNNTRASDSANNLTLILDKNEHSPKFLNIHSVQPLSPDDRLNLSVVAEILTQRIERDRLVSRNDLAVALDTLRHKSLRVGGESGSLPRGLSLLMISLREQFDLDQVMTCLIDSSTQRMIRLTVGRTGAMLTEKGMPVPDDIAARLAEPEITLSESTASVFSRLTANRSILLLLESRCQKMVDQVTTDSLCRVKVIVEELVASIRQQRELRKRTVRDGKLSAVSSRVLQSPSVETISAHLSRLLAHELGLSSVRISTIDTSPAFIATRCAMRDGRVESNANGCSILLSDVPVHHAVIQSGRTRVFSADAVLQAIGEPEAEAMLVSPPGASLIIPLRANDCVIGTLSGSRSFASKGKSFSRSDRQFAHQVAQLLSHILSRENQRHESLGWSVVHTSDRQLRSRLKSSLSGILGSLELIRSAEESNGDVKPYLKIIGTSAQRINDYLTIGTTTDRQPAPEKEHEHWH